MSQEIANCLKEYEIADVKVFVAAGDSGRFHVFGWDDFIREWIIFSPEDGLASRDEALAWAQEWLPKGLERPPARIANGRLP